MTPLMTIEEVATYLQIPKNTLYGWHSRGIGPACTKIGKHLRYREDDVRTWVDGQVSA